MSTPTPNIHERAARAEKADRIVTALVTARHATAENLRATATVLASDTPWGAALSEAIAKRCGEHTLSMTTRAMVATRLEEVVMVMGGRE